MGFYGPIPATKLAAQYNVLTRELTLYAEGVVREFTSGISFRQDTWMGGLKFTLGGWTGPIGPNEQPYKHTQSFRINLPRPHFNSKSVIIVTANHPNGIEVTINYVGLIHPGADLDVANKSDKASAAAESPAAPTPNDIHLNVMFKEPFTIRANAQVPKMGTVSINYDDTMLVLLGARIDNDDIVWTFNSLKIGDTQVVVTTTGGIADYVIVTYYDVHIFMPTV